MSDLPDIVPLSTLGRGASAIIDRLNNSGRAVFIMQEGHTSAVLLSKDEYERTRKELAILKSLARGEMEIDRGDGLDLEEVFAKVDELLASRR